MFYSCDSVFSDAIYAMIFVFKRLRGNTKRNKEADTDKWKRQVVVVSVEIPSTITVSCIGFKLTIS